MSNRSEKDISNRVFTASMPAKAKRTARSTGLFNKRLSPPASKPLQSGARLKHLFLLAYSIKLIKEDHFSCVHHEKCLSYPNRSLYTNERPEFFHTSSRCSDYSIVKELFNPHPEVRLPFPEVRYPQAFWPRSAFSCPQLGRRIIATIQILSTLSAEKNKTI